MVVFLELQLWFRHVLVTYSQVESSIRTSSCGFELLVAIKAILHHCNYYLDYFFLLMKAFTAASLLHCFILQWLSKLWDLLCELCVCLHIYMLKFNSMSIVCFFNHLFWSQRKCLLVSLSLRACLNRNKLNNFDGSVDVT